MRVARAAAAVGSMAAALIVAVPAEATFRGANGRIVFQAEWWGYGPLGVSQV